MSKQIKLKINNVAGYSGAVTVQTDENGVPLSKFWRRRIKDAEIDNCVEIVKSRKTKSTTGEAE